MKLLLNYYAINASLDFSNELEDLKTGGLKKLKKLFLMAIGFPVVTS